MNLRAPALVVVVAAVAACSSSGAPLLQTSYEQVIREDLAKVVEISTADSIGSGVSVKAFRTGVVTLSYQANGAGHD